MGGQMMKRYIYYIIAVLAVSAASGCTKSFDDSQFQNRLDAVQQTIDKVKADLDIYNTQISALQALAQANQAGASVKSVEEILENGVVAGYKILLDNGNSLVVLNGKDGEDGEHGTPGKDGHVGTDGTDGHSPKVGLVYQDGAYYWTVDGEFLKDSKGNLVPATANTNEITAKNGVTPVVSLEGGKWYVTFGDEKICLGEASATEDVLVADGVFADENAVVVEKGVVVVTLADGSKISVPMYQDYSITFSKTGQEDVLAYTLTGFFENPQVNVICSGGWDVDVNQTAATIAITPIAEGVRQDAVFNVLVSDGTHSVSGQFSVKEGNLIYE
jgi:hypothetical protein